MLQIVGARSEHAALLDVERFQPLFHRLLNEPRHGVEPLSPEHDLCRLQVGPRLAPPGIGLRSHDRVFLPLARCPTGISTKRSPVIAHLVSASPAAASTWRTRSVSASSRRVIGRPTTFVEITPRSISAVLNAPRAEAVGPSRPGVPASMIEKS